ncbi:acid-sensing ion channel 4-A-like [Anneissia japonica]|uniref:acid-sensing ion channel 4-A-like n=1 Tax=Anneissia japonica TaxID=1529436 RepID=UPI0014259903|nr:acid-sensing ion channel 4-A-like [Anneissia japonica]
MFTMEAWLKKDTATQTKNSIVYRLTDDDDNTQRRRCPGDLEQFSQNTTLHGLTFITSKDSSLARRLAWMLIVTSMMIVFIYLGIIHNVLRYLDRPINTIVSMNYVNDMDFPAVTICNYNQWRASMVGPELEDVVYWLSTSSIHYPNQTILDYLKSKEGELDKKVNIFNMTHQIEDMLRECTWKQIERCRADDFTRVLTGWGVCYTFNNPQNMNEVRKVKQSGSNYGLYMRINIEQDEYFFGDNTGAGLRILVHHQGQRPLVKSLGFSISPGFESHIGMRRTKVMNLGHPYKSNCRTKPLKYSQYSVQACNYECYVDHVVKTCGCQDYRMPGDARRCSAYESITCVNNASSDFINKERKCDCPTACTVNIYNVRVSSTYWPSTHVTEIKGITDVEARKNYMDVKIYFEELSLEEIQQIPAYGFEALLGDIGGIMGLLCGMSLTTVFEFLDFFLCAVIKTWKRS